MTSKSEKAKVYSKPTTKALADFAANLDYEDLSERTIANIKKALLDSIGCGILGSQFPWSKIVNQFIKEQGGRAEATIWTADFKGPASNVALGIGTMIHSFDFDDYHNAKLHPGAAVVPAAVCLGEAEGISGKELLTALVAGYETMIRVGLATGPGASRMKGWHLTGTCGTFGAAAAASKVLGLGADATASALGMAGTQSSGLWAFTADGSMSKRFHPGRASQSGIMAAGLARLGYLGPTQILEAEDGGFCRATSDDFDLSKATHNLGRKYHTEDVSIKPYAACGSLHSSIDAARELISRFRIRPQDIEKVILHTSHVIKTQCGYEYKPLSILQAQLSAQYCIAVAILEGHALVSQFTEEKIRDAKILELAKRVEVKVHPEIDNIYPEKFATILEIVTKGGESRSLRLDYPKGSPENPMSFEEVEQKFISISSDIIGSRRAEEIAGIVGAIEHLNDISALAELLA